MGELENDQGRSQRQQQRQYLLHIATRMISKIGVEGVQAKMLMGSEKESVKGQVRTGYAMIQVKDTWGYIQLGPFPLILYFTKRTLSNDTRGVSA